MRMRMHMHMTRVVRAGEAMAQAVVHRRQPAASASQAMCRLTEQGTVRATPSMMASAWTREQMYCMGMEGSRAMAQAQPRQEQYKAVQAAADLRMQLTCTLRRPVVGTLRGPVVGRLPRRPPGT